MSEPDETIARVLRCGICHQYLQGAQTLPCSHSFCNICIRLQPTAANQHHTCPLCSTKYQLSDVYDNRPLDIIAQHYAQLEQINGNYQRQVQQNLLTMNTSYFRTDSTDVRQIDAGVQYSEQLNDSDHNAVAFQDAHISVPSRSEEPSSTYSLTEQSQSRDIFGRGVYKCKACRQYVLLQSRRSHEQRCTAQRLSNFGLGTMRTRRSQAPKNPQNKRIKVINREADIILQKGNVTLASPIKQIRDDLVHFGFDKKYIDSVKAKNVLCSIYNTFVHKFRIFYEEQVRRMENAEAVDVTKIRIMLCDEILEGQTQIPGRFNLREHLMLCRELFWDQLVPQMSEPQRENLLQTMKTLEKRRKQQVINIDSQSAGTASSISSASD